MCVCVCVCVYVMGVCWSYCALLDGLHSQPLTPQTQQPLEEARITPRHLRPVHTPATPHTCHTMRRRHHVMSQCCRSNDWGRWTHYCSALGWREAQPLPCVACVSDLRYVTSLAVKWKPSRNSNACITTPHHTTRPQHTTTPQASHRIHTPGIGLL